MHPLKKTGVVLVVTFALIGLISVFAAGQYARTKPVHHAEWINRYARQNKLDPMLVVAVVKVESDFHADAVSPMDARGLMQILPKTGVWIAEKLDEKYSVDNLFDPETNIRYGTYYLRYLIDHFESEPLAIAAYNGGMGNVQEWLDKGVVTRESTSLENIPIEETREYVQKVQANRDMYDELYDGTLPEEDTDSPPLHKIVQNYRLLFENLVAFR